MRTLKIEGFKCFKSQTIELNKLTVLTGCNGAGKSTVIQSLLLMRQAIDNGILKHEPAEISLNEQYALQLGTYDDIVNGSSEEGIKFELDGNIYLLPFPDPKEEHIKTKVLLKKGNLGSTILNKTEFYYLNSERLGPREIADFKHANYISCGCHGERTAQALIYIDQTSAKVDSAKIGPNSSLEIVPENSQVNMKIQIGAWVNFLFPKINIQTEKLGNLHGRIKVRDEKNGGIENMAPNFGFGVSYVLPIIVDCILAPQGSLVIVENPEAHLHPSAQSRIGYFLGRMANAGVEIIVETHSDLVVSGIQLAVAKKDLPSNMVNILYFSREDNNDIVHTMTMNDKGELSDWPRGFFDQSQIDYAELFKLRRENG